VSGGEGTNLSGRKLGADVKFAELFGDKTSLIIYSFMFGPSWDKPCMSCTSLMDGFDRAWYAVAQDAAFAAISKAPPEKIDAWAKPRGWMQMPLVSGFKSSFQRDYGCQQPDNGVAVLESDGLHAGGAARSRHTAAEVCQRVSGEELRANDG
jgi:predicted dithiol-disulfide oxidoreductase (DUF899 family)